MKVKRKDKIQDLMPLVRRSLDLGHYLDTRHAMGRQMKRRISRPEVLSVLRHGYHEKHKDQYEESFQAWNYAVRGKTPDKRELRVIISFDKNNMLIITAIDLDV